ncbi:thioredoxin-dependent thiol peroxidase [Candidatus Azambacteria bacterium]|nr:thioredoxin-dependent thiol peroxidase [Candidatus Azambacteria bacterium]
MLTVGKKAPEFTLKDQDGNTRSLSDYLGRRVLLYFYPKDDTPGCTKEACTIRDSFPHFAGLDAVVFGVSVDSVKSHKKFAEKYKLPFTLLADEAKEVVEKYGVWGEKKFMGKAYRGTNRTSFLINQTGAIEKIYEKVNPITHAEEVLTDIKSMKQ